MKKMFLLLMLVFATFCGSAMADEAYVLALNGASVGTSSAVIDLDGYDGFFVSASGQGQVQYTWSKATDGTFVGGSAATVPANAYVPKQARYVKLRNAGTGGNLVTAYYSRHFNPTIVVDAAGNTLLALQQGPAGTEPWLMDVEKVGGADVIGAHDIISSGDSIVQTGSVLYGWYHNDEQAEVLSGYFDGFGHMQLGTAQRLWGDVAVADAQDLNGVIWTLDSPMNAPLGIGVVAGYDPTFASIQGVTTNQGIGDSYSPIGLDTNQAYLGGTVLANQSNAPGWMPSALGDGFENPIGSTFIGSGQSLNVASALFASDLTPLSANAGTFPYDNSLYELLVANDIVAVGGVATYPAFNPWSDGLDNDSGNPKLQGVGALNMAYSTADQFNYEITLSYEGDGEAASERYALDTSLIFWGPGGTAVSAAQDLFNGVLANPDDGSFKAPFIGSNTFGLSADGESLQNVTVDSVSALAGISDPVASMVYSRSADTAFNSDTYVATGSLTLNAGIVLENYTVTADWVGSLGADTFTATLKGSTTGAFAGEERTLGTMTEGTSNLLLSVVSKPYPYTKIFLSALSLDTATGLILSGVAK